MIKVILFDVGGVLFQREHKTPNGHFGPFPLRFASQYNVDPSVYMKLRNKLWPAYKTAQISGKDFWTRIFEGLSLESDIEGAFALYGSLLVVIPGIMDIVRELHERGWLLVLTNNEAKEYDEMRDRALGLSRYFTFRFPSWKFGVAKPDPRYFEMVLERLGVPPESCLFIDDKENNVEVAKRFGIRGIVFLGAEQLRVELRRFGIKTKE